MTCTRRERLAGMMLLFTALFNITDYFLTMRALEMGMEEWNPLVRSWIHSGALPIVKIVIIPAALLLIWKLRSNYQSRLYLYAGIIFSVYFLLMGYFILVFQLNNLSTKIF